MGSNTWSIKGRLISLDVARLWDALSSICMATEPLFPKPINSIRWAIGSRDEWVTHSDAIVKLPEIKAQVPEVEGSLDLRLYHKEVTSNLGLELIPDCYLDLLIDRFRDEFAATISTVGQNNANRIFEMIMTAARIVPTQLPDHYKYLESFVGKLFADYPEYEKNVFLIMRFRDEKPFPEIVTTLRKLCTDNGLILLRADDREYTGDLWDNVMTYMYSCASAIAVFDQINYREFNPNVAIEVGFMLAMGKPVLLLKDQAITAMPTDIVGKTYRPFNTYDAASTIPPQVQKWIKDYRLGGA